MFKVVQPAAQLILGHFHHSQKTTVPIGSYSPLLPTPTPGNRLPFSIYGFAYSEHFI